MANPQPYSADFPSQIVKEGKVQVLVPDLAAYGVVPSDYAPSRAPVFYNPVMEFNRDISVLAFKAYQHIVNREVTICEPLTSQGIRAIRYAAEVENVGAILASDMNTHAFELAKHNVALNGLQGKITLENRDANCVLSCNAAPNKRFDIVDIDPFGTPVPYLDSAFRALRNNGLLAATATDLAPLCGVHAKACLRKYGGKPLRTEYCHELAVRLLAGCMASMAVQHDVGIRLLFSHSTDHYVRVYAQISYGCKKADVTLKSTGYILHCFSCMHREIQPQPFSSLVCPECGAKMDYAGPLWTGAIADPAFVNALIVESQRTPFKSSAKITKLLTLIQTEAQAPPTYYVIDKLSGKLGIPAPSVQAVLNGLREGGCQAVQTHFNTRGIKTNASAQIIHKVLQQIVVFK